MEINIGGRGETGMGVPTNVTSIVGLAKILLACCDTCIRRVLICGFKVKQLCWYLVQFHFIVSFNWIIFSPDVKSI